MLYGFFYKNKKTFKCSYKLFLKPLNAVWFFYKNKKTFKCSYKLFFEATYNVLKHFQIFLYTNTKNILLIHTYAQKWAFPEKKIVPPVKDINFLTPLDFQSILSREMRMEISIFPQILTYPLEFQLLSLYPQETSIDILNRGV